MHWKSFEKKLHVNAFWSKVFACQRSKHACNVGTAQKWSFFIKDFSVNVNKSVVFYGPGPCLLNKSFMENFISGNVGSL